MITLKSVRVDIELRALGKPERVGSQARDEEENKQNNRRPNKFIYYKWDVFLGSKCSWVSVQRSFHFWCKWMWSWPAERNFMRECYGTVRNILHNIFLYYRCAHMYMSFGWADRPYECPSSQNESENLALAENHYRSSPPEPIPLDLEAKVKAINGKFCDFYYLWLCIEVSDKSRSGRKEWTHQ